MATTVVNATPARESGSGAGVLLGIVVFVIAIAILLFYGLPFIQRSFSTTGSQVNIPDHVNVNVQKGK